MTITEQLTKTIIEKLLKGEDYRIEIVNLINAEFLQFTIGFLKLIVGAKLKVQDEDTDWYRKEFLDPSLPPQKIAIYSGINKKTIHNMYNSSRKEIVIRASNEHYDSLREAIENLVAGERELSVALTIEFNDHKVKLDIGESLVVINTLAVKRSELRGGLWSTAGKQVERPLMLTLCKLYGVNEKNYTVRSGEMTGGSTSFEREVDFYLVENDNQHRCEVKLMGKGNPESADAIIARDSKVFVADKLSDTNKSQLDSRKVEWVELRCEGGFRRFERVLTSLNIPHIELPEDTNISEKLKEIFEEIF